VSADAAGADAVTGASVRERYERVAAAFDDVVEHIDDWDAVVPCDGWLARDVVEHLTGWVPGFVSSFAGIDAPPPAPDDDPAGAWRHLDGTIRAWLDDPDVAAIEFDGPMGRTDLATAIDRFVTPDVMIHTWDLARASGLDDRLDDDLAAEMLAGVEPIDEQLRASGHYGPRVEVPDDADVQDRLLGFLGRDPAWRPVSTA
jgi:uncharacterized protein (TIGR03086 family)